MRRLSVETATAKKSRNSAADLRIDPRNLGVETDEKAKTSVEGLGSTQAVRCSSVQTGENP